MRVKLIDNTSHVNFLTPALPNPQQPPPPQSPRRRTLRLCKPRNSFPRRIYVPSQHPTPNTCSLKIIPIGLVYPPAPPASIGCAGRDAVALRAPVQFYRKLAALRAAHTITVYQGAAVLASARFVGVRLLRTCGGHCSTPHLYAMALKPAEFIGASTGRSQVSP
jgi:hypothetical protein